MSQVDEFQLLLHEINARNMTLNEYFQVAVPIEKLASS